MRSISGLPSEDELLLLDEERCMLGTDALIFVLPANLNMDDPYSVRALKDLSTCQVFEDKKGDSESADFNTSTLCKVKSQYT